MAATKGDVAIVRALLDMGADPLVENLVRPCVGLPYWWLVHTLDGLPWHK